MATPEPNPILIATAVTGAITGTSALLLSIYNAVVAARLRKAQTKVRASWGFAMLPGDKTLDVLQTQISNHGQVPVVVSSCHLKVEGVEGVMQVPYGHVFGETFPTKVEPGASFSYSYDYEKLKKSLRTSGRSGKLKVFAVFNDQLGNSHKARKAHLIDLDS